MLLDYFIYIYISFLCTNQSLAAWFKEGDENIEDEDPEAEEENEEDDRGDHGGEYEEDREEMMGNIGSDGECDELDDLPCSRGNQWKGPISRKPSQTSVYLQEWDIPFEQLDLGELIGKVRIHNSVIDASVRR